ncbi:2-C-methyl-D-erythritol 4-phosphate cytidylyltransferase [bacterium]|nr:2-C-methyl-D-erythritol 4-phosphate cytidylyltransferase [bacterium]
MREEFAAAVVLAAGSGTRLGFGYPKALVEVGGRPLVRRSLEALAAARGVGAAVVVVPPGDDGARVAAAAAGPLRFADGSSAEPIVVVGGARRRDSVLNGARAAEGAAHVLVHDAARALATPALAERVLEAARVHGAAIPAAPVPDTLVRDDGGFVGDEVPRAGVHAVQTPQGFERALLLAAHEAADPAWDAPDDGTVARRFGRRVALVPGDPENLKITYPGDLARAEAILAARGETTMAATRTGIGWDVHPFAAGRPTVLAGVVLAEEFGPVGHSDGDALSHAVCDALLGAAAAGDIGTLFPDTDPRWKGAPGPDLVRRTVAFLAERGFAPLQVDAVVVCDAPKIGPRRDEVRAALAAALGIPADNVGLKGKRTEGLGGLAGGKGIACHAVAVVAPRAPAPR